jgi:hypothetical protein
MTSPTKLIVSNLKLKTVQYRTPNKIMPKIKALKTALARFNIV